jgi:iron(III) transport system substrate-binding protein
MFGRSYVSLGAMPAPATAQTRSETLQTIAKLKGNERETRIREGARKEGNLVWYSSATAEDALALTRKFQETYPFVNVQHLRAPSEKMIERILLESRAGSLKADLIAFGNRAHRPRPKETPAEACRGR